MRKAVMGLFAAGVLAVALVPHNIVAHAQAPNRPAPPPPKIKVGDMAPDFTMLAYDGQGVTPVSLKDFRGKKNVALAFYVFAFTGG